MSESWTLEKTIRVHSGGGLSRKTNGMEGGFCGNLSQICPLLAQKCIDGGICLWRNEEGLPGLARSPCEDWMSRSGQWMPGFCEFMWGGQCKTEAAQDGSGRRLMFSALAAWLVGRLRHKGDANACR